MGFGGRLAGYKNVLFQPSLLRLAFAFDLQASVLEWNGWMDNGTASSAGDEVLCSCSAFLFRNETSLGQRLCMNRGQLAIEGPAIVKYLKDAGARDRRRQQNTDASSEMHAGRPSE